MSANVSLQGGGNPDATLLEDWHQTEAACVPGFHALGRIAGLMQRHGVVEPVALASVLAVATFGQPMELAQVAALMLEELDTAAMAASVESGPDWFRMRSPSKGLLLVLDAHAPLLWLLAGHGQTGTLCFVGPHGSHARLRRVCEGEGERKRARLEVMGGAQFKSYCRGALRRQIDIEALLAMLMDSTFYGDPTAAADARPELPMLEQAVVLARERGIACVAPALALSRSEARADQAMLREHCLHVWHLAGQDESDALVSSSPG